MRPQRTHKRAQASQRCPDEEPGRQQDREGEQGQVEGGHVVVKGRPIMPGRRPAAREINPARTLRSSWAGQGRSTAGRPYLLAAPPAAPRRSAAEPGPRSPSS